MKMSEKEFMENLAFVLVMVIATAGMMIISAFAGSAEVAIFIAVITIVMCGLTMVFIEEQGH